MEKPTTKLKAIVNIFNLLAKPTSLVYIPPHPPYSPRGGENATACANKGGFVVSLVPAEARVRKGKSSSGADQEPTSPKVSCTGQIKRRKTKTKKKKKNLLEQQPCRTSTSTSTLHADRRENNRIFTENTKSVRGPTAAAALAEFDWEKVEREMKMDAENCGVVKEARKEVNLWERRAKASRPTPLVVQQ